VLAAALVETDTLTVTLEQPTDPGAGQPTGPSIATRLLSRWRTSRHLTSTRTWP
jgi:anti-sigma-K factor RskA